MPAATRPESWWSRPPEEVARRLDVDPQRGLSAETVAQHREQFGDNRLEDAGPVGLWKLLWESIKSPMMLLLLTIAGISLAFGQVREAVVMAFVVAMYVGIHVLNKARADRTMARLREVQAPKTTVLRAGEREEIAVEDVVVGDVLPLQSGSRIPADARLLSTAGLLVDEAALTGESAPVRKDAHADVAPDAPLAERPTAVFAGTTVLDGQGRALVMAVGGQSELGRVAALSTQAESEPTPLQREMEDLTHTLVYIAIGISLLIPLVGLLRGFDLRQMLLTWLSLTFLMVPGQPPIIIAMALALAALELARRQVIVRRLHGAETLGAVEVVLSDKTGTMTENVMRLSRVLLPTGERLAFDEDGDSDVQQTLRRFLRLAAPAIPEGSKNPTDRAVIDAAGTLEGWQPPQPGQLVDLTGFSRGGDYRSVAYRGEAGTRLFVTGRPAVLIDRSNRRSVYAEGEDTTGWPAEEHEHVKAQVVELAAEGQRLAGYAYRAGEAADEEPRDLTFAGVAVISDPVRPEVPEAIDALRQAGVRTVMVTGDIPETAAYVAGQVGLDTSRVQTGADLKGRADEELGSLIENVDVFARVTPEQKLRLVKAFQEAGRTVAVTGDGVNDAPALRTAHIGVAMGQKGTDVAREAADLVLTDDNLAHLPDGVAIGRKAYDNFRKGLTYYLSAKAILLAIFIVPLLAGVPFPLAPIQIIFTELLMDLASSTIFVSEAAEPDVMQRKPRRRTRFMSWTVGRAILRNMAGLTVVILAIYFGSLALGYESANARTAAFATWLLGHIVLALNVKQERVSLIERGLFSNRAGIGWLVGMVVFVLAMTFVPFVRSILETSTLSGLQWIAVVAGAVLASSWMAVL